MKLHRFFFGGILPLVMLVGCLSAQKAQLDRFLGAHSSELVAEWGPPQSVMPDGHGGEIWTYFTQRQWTLPGQATTTYRTIPPVYPSPYYPQPTYGTATTTITPPQTQGYTARRTFFIDSNGIIYRYAARGA